jgi:hypothetical protein
MPKGADWIASNGDRIMDGFFCSPLSCRHDALVYFPFCFATIYFSTKETVCHLKITEENTRW